MVRGRARRAANAVQVVPCKLRDSKARPEGPTGRVRVGEPHELCELRYDPGPRSTPRSDPPGSLRERPPRELHSSRRSRTDALEKDADRVGRAPLQNRRLHMDHPVRHKSPVPLPIVGTEERRPAPGPKSLPGTERRAPPVDQIGRSACETGPIEEELLDPDTCGPDRVNRSDRRPALGGLRSHHDLQRRRIERNYGERHEALCLREVAHPSDQRHLDTDSAFRLEPFGKVRPVWFCPTLLTVVRAVDGRWAAGRTGDIR
jgi:hypothetical protein